MKTFGGLGIGLSLVFGCLLLALVAEVYYLLRWKKKKKNSKRITNSELDEEYNGYAKELIQLLCFKRPSSLQPSNENRDESGRNSCHEQQDIELGSSKDLLLKALGGDGGFEAELMRLHNQRFLFTIKEETKEDLESEDGKSRKGSRTRSLSDLVSTINDNNTPSFLTPLASPPLKSSPLNPKLESYHHHGFNPLFESEGELEFNKFRSSSPPPKFKFLRDAEEKLIRRLMEEAKRKRECVQDSGVQADKKSSKQEIANEKEGSFLKFMNATKSRETERVRNFPETVPSSSSQVLPLASSPTNLRPLDQKPIVH